MGQDVSNRCVLWGVGPDATEEQAICRCEEDSLDHKR